jgi:hypothetical protein
MNSQVGEPPCQPAKPLGMGLCTLERQRVLRVRQRLPRVRERIGGPGALLRREGRVGMGAEGGRRVVHGYAPFGHFFLGVHKARGDTDISLVPRRRMADVYLAMTRSRPRLLTERPVTTGASGEH